MKIYAKQVPPEYQESHFCVDGLQDIILTGNRDYDGYCPEWAENLSKRLDEVLNEWDNMRSGNRYYDTWADALADILPPFKRAGYDRKDRMEWGAIACRWASTHNALEEVHVVLDALNLITGKRWEWTTLHGCCQSDWIECFYQADAYSKEAINAIETEYFNTGSEWHIQEDENDDGYYQYCVGWDSDIIRAEIAEGANVSLEDVVLYEFDGWTRTASYKTV